MIGSLIAALVLLLVLAVFVIIWPYGIVAMAHSILWQLIRDARENVQDAPGFGEQLPHAVALGVYFIIWIPIGLLALPFFIVGSLLGLD